MTPEDEPLLALLRDFDYARLPGPVYEEWEEAVWQVRERITDGKNRELAREVIPIMVGVLELTVPGEASDIDIREEAIRMLGEAPEMLDEHAKALLRAAVVDDDVHEVAWIAAGVLDDVDPNEGDVAWMAYTGRADAPEHVRNSPKPV